MIARLRLARRRQAVQRFPDYIPGMDEYPAVPYYSFDGRSFYYDSTGLALQLDAQAAPDEPLVPGGAAGFLGRLIEPS